MVAAGPRDAGRTRERLLEAARRHFAADGYDRVTVRAIAADAGVSPNLVTRYFGGKRGLLDAATEVGLGMDAILAGPHRTLGARIARHVVDRWEDRSGNDPLLGMMRAAMTDRSGSEHMAAFYRREATGPLTAHLAAPDAGERASAVSALIMGTIVQRYVLHAGPAAAGDRDQVASWLGHALQLLLTGAPFDTDTPPNPPPNTPPKPRRSPG